MTNVVKLLLISENSKRSIWPLRESNVMQNVLNVKRKPSVRKKSDKVDREKGQFVYYCNCAASEYHPYRIVQAPVDPYKQQKVLINTLANYLNRLSLTTVSHLNSSSSFDSSVDEVTLPVVKWDGEQPQEGSFLQKKTVDQSDKAATFGGGRRKSKRDKKKAMATNKVRTVSLI